MNATWQRCRVHFMRNLLAHAGKSGRRVVAAFVATAFAQEDAQTAKTQWRQVADQLRPKAPKLANLMDQAEPDVLAYMTFPKEHRTKLHSTNPIERLNGEIKRRTNVVGIFPNEAAITRLIGAILLEQNDDWAVQRARYMTLESITPSGHDDLIRLPQTAARSIRLNPPETVRRSELLHHFLGHDPNSHEIGTTINQYRSGYDTIYPVLSSGCGDPPRTSGRSYLSTIGDLSATHYNQYKIPSVLVAARGSSHQACGRPVRGDGSNRFHTIDPYQLMIGSARSRLPEAFQVTRVPRSVLRPGTGRIRRFAWGRGNQAGGLETKFLAARSRVLRLRVLMTGAQDRGVQR